MHETDTLSTLASDLILKYPNAYEKLVVRSETPSDSLTLLAAAKPDQLLAVPVKSYVAASAMLCGLWLFHDGLEGCHAIAQQTPQSLMRPRTKSLELMRLSDEEMSLSDLTDTLNFWHAILHRREGDFSNSQYWYGRVAGHPIMQAIGVEVGNVINPLPADKSLLRIMHDGWHPNHFVDLVEDVSANPHDARLPTVVAIQRIEWRMLFEHCTRLASGQ